MIKMMLTINLIIIIIIIIIIITITIKRRGRYKIPATANTELFVALYNERKLKQN